MEFGLLQDIGVCYAFVEYEDLIGVHNALKVYFFLSLYKILSVCPF